MVNTFLPFNKDIQKKDWALPFCILWPRHGGPPTLTVTRSWDTLFSYINENWVGWGETNHKVRYFDFHPFPLSKLPPLPVLNLGRSLRHWVGGAGGCKQRAAVGDCSAASQSSGALGRTCGCRILIYRSLPALVPSTALSTIDGKQTICFLTFSGKSKRRQRKIDVRKRSVHWSMLSPLLPPNLLP